MSTLNSVRLKHLASIRVSNVDKRTLEDQASVRLCNYTDVYYNEVITGDLPFMQATATLGQIREFALRAGDVLITKDSETPDDIAVAARVDASVAGVVCGYHLALLRPIYEERVKPPYLFWALKAASARQQFSAAATGVTRFGLRTEAIANLRVPLHESQQQQVIADFLYVETGRIDELIARKRRMIDLMRQRGLAVGDRWARSLFLTWGGVPLRRLTDRIEQGWSPQCESVQAAPAEWGVLNLDPPMRRLVEAGRIMKRVP